MTKNKKWLALLLLIGMFGFVLLFDWFRVLPLFTAETGFMFMISQFILAGAVVGLLMSWKHLKTLF